MSLEQERNPNQRVLPVHEVRRILGRPFLHNPPDSPFEKGGLAPGLPASRSAPGRWKADRYSREMDDIRQLCLLEGVDQDEVRGYFEKYGCPEDYERLTRGSA